VHSAERPLGCEQCPFRCVRASDLTHHLKTVHNGERPYGCTSAGCDFQVR
jgi:hypothetical protein